MSRPQRWPLRADHDPQLQQPRLDLVGLTHCVRSPVKFCSLASSCADSPHHSQKFQLQHSDTMIALHGLEDSDVRASFVLLKVSEKTSWNTVREPGIAQALQHGNPSNRWAETLYIHSFYPHAAMPSRFRGRRHLRYIPHFEHHQC